jgi:L-iditol 2-dehydrogenase
MKALNLTAYNTFKLDEFPEPQLGPNDVLVQVKACGICGSDVHGMDGSTGRRKPPIIMGHEAAGVIAKAGSAVRNWKPGNRVTFDSTVYCGTCAFCRQGLINLCDNRRVLGVSCDDYRCNGAFAEFVAVPEHILYKLPDNLPFEQAALVEALSVAVHAVNRTPHSVGDTAVVVGAGMIGQLIIQVLRVSGCSRIVAIDLEREKLDMAKRFGADVCLKADDGDPVAEVMKLTGGRGADIAFEAVGVTPTIRTAVQVLRKSGSLTLVGNLSPQIDLLLQAVVTRELTLRGTCASCGEYPACLDLIARGAVDVKPLISAVAPLEEGAQWFKRLHAKEKGLIKVVLTV